MKAYWSETRPNGKPVEAGTFCWITDLEDGSPVIATYGKTTEEVLEKLASQNANAQLALARRATVAQTAQPGNHPAAQGRRPLSPDEIMQATVDLQNPAKSAGAIATLVQEATGIDFQAESIKRFADLGMEWEREHPEFYPHPGNRKMLAETAGRKVGGKLGLITKVMLTQTFSELLQSGLLFEESQNLNPPTPPVLPDESQVQHLERPRGTRFATGARSTTFRAPQSVQTRTVKYTEEEIRTMPESKYRRLIETNDQDFAAACEFHFPQQRATA
jgi:hypothetical protein